MPSGSGLNHLGDKRRQVLKRNEPGEGKEKRTGNLPPKTDATGEKRNGRGEGRDDDSKLSFPVAGMTHSLTPLTLLQLRPGSDQSES
jgi:hypothetical protein